MEVAVVLVGLEPLLVYQYPLVLHILLLLVQVEQALRHLMALRQEVGIILLFLAHPHLALLHLLAVDEVLVEGLQQHQPVDRVVVRLMVKLQVRLEILLL